MILNYFDNVKNFIKDCGGTLLSDSYINNSESLTLICPKCGLIFERNFSNIQQRKSIECISCSYYSRAEDRVKKNEKKVREMAESLGATLLEYKGHKNRSVFLCSKCNKTFEKYIQSLKASKSPFCKQCTKTILMSKLKTDINVIKSFIEDLGGELVSTSFEHSCANLKVKCNVCKKTYNRSWKYIKDTENITCASCSKSRSLGERKIERFLIKNNIEFKSEKTFDGCIDKGKLRFDFYLPHLNTCIEYDGKQHYTPYTDFGGSETFEDRVRKDGIKNEFCKDNNITLIRIHYNDFRRIDKILEKNNIIPSQTNRETFGSV